MGWDRKHIEGSLEYLYNGAQIHIDQKAHLSAYTASVIGLHHTNGPRATHIPDHRNFIGAIAFQQIPTNDGPFIAAPRRVGVGVNLKGLRIGVCVA